MKKQIIQTTAGNIAVFIKQHPSQETPIVFLHGVYFDHRLWEKFTSQINDRTVIAIDMPLHGESVENIKADWNLDDCADMLLQVIDSLKLQQVIAVGHSWGSMTILRAAGKAPGRFASAGLCNMPFQAATKQEKRNIKIQHTAMIFKGFYMKQAAKALMSKESLTRHPEMMQQLIMPMSKMPSKAIRYTDRAVRINATDATPLIRSLQVRTMALTGESDYVGTPPLPQAHIVKGGHVSPLEAPEEVYKMIRSLMSR